MRRPIEYKSGDRVVPIGFFCTAKVPPVGVVKSVRDVSDIHSPSLQIVTVDWIDCGLQRQFCNTNLRRA